MGIGEWAAAFIAAAVSGTITILGAVVWGVRQEGRINTSNQKLSDQDRLHTQRVDALGTLIEARFNATDNRLERIERGMNGYLRGGSHDRR